MSDQELQRLCEQISQRNFARPFKHRIYFNRRLRTTGGRYYLQTHNIEINPKMLSAFSKETLIGVIKHELCHYHLHMAGFSGQHQTKEFKQLLKAVGGLRYAPRIDHPRYTYECQKCHQQYQRNRFVDTSKFVCGKCRGKLRLITRHHKGANL
ncbi:SprT family protein [Nicoliella spurrieriana]|uniref:SprT family protein n=1 Tax=Nicoliella spurrieriana TaxID=2925830 RepID=A0A976RSI5_9LACO|nr:SprT family protein [Nicoliella spurrieriana]UQS87034.1 SprT family protein [Nicoliella spurrieriana]